MPGRYCKVILIIASNTLNSFIYLASQSPRRQELLKQIGVHFELLLPQVDEDTESIEIALPHEAEAAFVRRLGVKLLQLLGVERHAIGRVDEGLAGDARHHQAAKTTELRAPLAQPDEELVQ